MLVNPINACKDGFSMSCSEVQLIPVSSLRVKSQLENKIGWKLQVEGVRNWGRIRRGRESAATNILCQHIPAMPHYATMPLSLICHTILTHACLNP